MNIQKINKRWLLFILAVIAQFASIFYFSFRSEETLQTGTALKFRLTGYDPHDFFRGEYLRLRFRDNKIELSEEEKRLASERKEVYVVFEEDGNGFSIPKGISTTPTNSSLKIEGLHDGYFSYPFDRLWMNQEDCPIAERLINQAVANGEDVYAIIYVKDGEGVLSAVEIDGTDLRNLVDSEGARKEEVETDATALPEPETDSLQSATEDSIKNIVIEEMTK